MLLTPQIRFKKKMFFTILHAPGLGDLDLYIKLINLNI